MKQPKCDSEVKAKLQPAGPTSRFLGASWPGERSIKCAGVVELVDTQDLGSCAFGCEGSSPSFGTSLIVSLAKLAQRGSRLAAAYFVVTRRR